MKRTKSCLPQPLGKVSLCVCIVVETVAAVFLFIWRVVILLQGNNECTRKENIVETSILSSTELFLGDSTITSSGTEVVPVDECSDQPCDVSRTYYNIISILLVSFMLLSVLFAVGVKKKSKDLVKSYVDINATLTVLCLIVYILLLTEGNVEKKFIALTTFFLLLRLTGIFLGVSYYRDGFGATETNTVQVNYQTSNATKQGSDLSEGILSL